MVTFLVSPRRTHNWTSVKLPTHAIVKSPTHLMLTVMPRPRPVMRSQNHQLSWNALAGPCSCWFVNEEKANTVKAVPTMRGESSRIKRAWVKRPFSAHWLALLSSRVSGHVGSLLRTKDDKARAQSRSRSAATSSFQGEEHQGSEKNTTDSREHAHGDIRDTRLDVVLANLLEVEIAPESSEISGQCDEHLSQWRVDIHKEFTLDVL